MNLIISFLIVGVLFFLYAVWKNPDKIKGFETFPAFLLGAFIAVWMWPTFLYYQTGHTKK